MIALYGLEAMVRGALAALAALLPASWYFWRWAATLAPGHRALRPFVTCCMAYGAMVVSGAIWALGFEREGYASNAMAGALVGGAIAGLLTFLILLMIPRKA